MVILKMNEIARNYKDGLTDRSFNNQSQSKMPRNKKKKNGNKKETKK